MKWLVLLITLVTVTCDAGATAMQKKVALTRVKSNVVAQHQLVNARRRTATARSSTSGALDPYPRTRAGAV